MDSKNEQQPHWIQTKHKISKQLNFYLFHHYSLQKMTKDSVLIVETHWSRNTKFQDGKCLFYDPVNFIIKV